MVRYSVKIRWSDNVCTELTTIEEAFGNDTIDVPEIVSCSDGSISNTLFNNAAAKVPPLLTPVVMDETSSVAEVLAVDMTEKVSFGVAVVGAHVDASSFH